MVDKLVAEMQEAIEQALHDMYEANGGGANPIWHSEAIAQACAAIAQKRVNELEAENARLRAERDALLQRPIDLAKMDSIDDDASGKMVAYYWWQQAQDARAALPTMLKGNGDG